MKIAICGTHSTGKSTFIRRMCSHLNQMKIQYRVVKDMAISSPLPILQRQTVESTIWIASTEIATEVAATADASLVLVDRSVLDPWAYFMATDQATGAPESLLSSLESIIAAWLPTYDLIYRTKLNPNIPIEDDGHRDIDPQYRILIDQMFDRALSRFKVATTELPTNVEESEISLLINKRKV